MILHQVFTSPTRDHNLQHCFEHCQTGNGVLLLQDAVYAIQHSLIDHLIKKGVSVYILQNDLQARGLSQINPAIKLIDDKQWLALCLQYDNVMSWS
jgi:tRNA 2-thiouridine synthesizing protein B